jgi:hypothetical protein
MSASYCYLNADNEFNITDAGNSIFFSARCIKDAKAKNSDPGKEEETVF